MSIQITEFGIILLLILTNGLFALSEMALISARKSKLRSAAEQGNKKARKVLELSEAPTRFLSTIQIGISLVGTLAGAFGGASLARTIAAWLNQYPSVAPHSHSISLGIVVLFISYLSLVLGELVPKRLALNNAESIAIVVAPFLQKLCLLMSPFIHILGFSTETVLRIIGQSNRSPSPLSQEEIRILIAESNETGILSASESDILDRVLQLRERKAWSVMKPRPEIVWLDIEDTSEQNWEKILSSGHSKYPVGKGELDALLGTVHVKDLLERICKNGKMDLVGNLKQPLIVPETKLTIEILDMFKHSNAHMAMVVNEFGEIEGMVTLGDILEALVGYVLTQDEEEEPEAIQHSDGSWTFDGMLPIHEFRQHLNLKSWPGEESGYYQTLGGFIMAQLGHIPTPGEKIKWAGFKFEVQEMDKHRIARVLVTPLRDRSKSNHKK